MKCDPKIKHQIARIHGQMNGVMNMMEEERSCQEIVTQLSAIRASVDKVISVIVTENLVQTIEAKHQIQLDDVEQELNLLLKHR